MKILDKISSCLTKALEKFFFKLGFTVATYPWTTIIISSIVCLSSMTGLIWFHRTTDYEILWAPSNTNALENKRWVEKNFPKDYRMEYLILESPNILDYKSVQYLFQIDKKLRNITSPKYGKTYDDLCQKTLTSCIYSSLLQIWNNRKGEPDENVIMGLTNDQIIKDATNAWNKNLFELKTLLNLPKFTNNQLVSAKATLSIWLLKNNASDFKEGDLPRDLVAEDWEDELSQFLSKRTDHQPDVSGAPVGAKAYFFTEKSFQDEIVTSIDDGMYIFGAGFTLILIFSLFVTSEFNPVNQRVMLLMIGFIVIAMSIGSSFGLGFHLGVIYADLHPIIPFLLLGIGVDDIFIIIKSTDNLKKEEKELPLPERVGLVIQHSGVSITVTSLTDLIAFIISSTTSIPLLRAFCFSVALGITFLYFFVITFFTAWYCLDEQRIQDMKAFPWLSDKTYPNSFKKTSWFHKMYQKYYVEYLFKKPVQVIFCGISLTVFGFGLYGALNITKDYDPITYMRQTSYQVKFIEAKNRLYPGFGDMVDLYVGDIPYWKNDDQMMQIHQVVSTCEYVRPESHSKYWYLKIKNECSSEKLDCTKEQKFQEAVVKASVKDPSIFVDLRLNISVLDNFQDYIDLKWYIKASRSQIQYGYLANVEEQSQAMDSVVEGLEKIVFKNSEFLSPIAKSLAFHQWTANKIISIELIRNLGLNFACITVVLFMLLANIQLSLIVLLVVAMTITEIAGFAYFVGLHIEIVTSLELIISVGLVLDYSAHIGVSYTIQKTGSRMERSKKALLEMGPAIFSGGFSTFLAFVILFSNDSYIFTSFCEMLGFGVLFGLWNALTFMPILLSHFGTTSRVNDDEKITTLSLGGNVNMGFMSTDNSKGIPPMEEKTNAWVDTSPQSDSKDIAKF